MKIPTLNKFACVCVCLISLACSTGRTPAATASPEVQPTPEPTPPPRLPSVSLAVPDGNQLAFWLRASGVQIYACESAGWSLKAPDASLVNEAGKPIVRHYAGPTWESLEDGSQVAASKLEAFTEDSSAIPALLLKASSHHGAGRMAEVSFIQRLETTGGLAPRAGCDAEHAGAESRVPYTASYYFYRAAQAR